MDPATQFNPQQMQMLMALMGQKQPDQTGTGLGAPGLSQQSQAMPGPNQDAYGAMMQPPPMAEPPPPIF